MAYRLPLLAALLCLGGMLPGCTVCQLARLVSLEEPQQFDFKKDRKISLVTYRALADEAWATTGAYCPDDCASTDYTWGFREGFAEYVYAGGSGDPPALPPRSYWQSDMRTPEGATAVRSWFQGYRYGVQVAREGGYRQSAMVVVSASVRDCDACGRPSGCGEDECDTCQSGSHGNSDSWGGDSAFEIDGPALQQPEFQQFEIPHPVEEPLSPEVIIPAPESVPLPPTTPPVPPIDRSVEEESDMPMLLETELRDTELLNTDFWKAKDSTSSVPPPVSIPKQSVRHVPSSSASMNIQSSAARNLPARRVPSQQHPVTQAFFPIVR